MVGSQQGQIPADRERFFVGAGGDPQHSAGRGRIDGLLKAGPGTGRLPNANGAGRQGRRARQRGRTRGFPYLEHHRQQLGGSGAQGVVGAIARIEAPAAIGLQGKPRRFPAQQRVFSWPTTIGILAE